MAESFLKTLAVKRHVLLPLIHEFNMSPARYIHGSWIDAIVKQALFERLKKSGRAEKRLSGLILERFELNRDHVFDFEDRDRRLALIDSRSLLRLIFFTGTALNASRIAAIVQREPLLSLKKRIGERAHLFALKKAPFLIGRSEIPPAQEQGSADLKRQITQSGMKCFGACFDQEPEALTRRLLFKLPKGLCSGLGPAGPGLGKKRAGTIMRKVLLAEVGPQWAPYFS
jgi:hypothetical protein